MTLKHLLMPLAAAALISSCDQQVTTTKVAAEAEPEAAPSAAVTAALEAQPIGKKLLGNTVSLVDGQFQAADLTAAPDYYLVYYSASW